MQKRKIAGGIIFLSIGALIFAFLCEVFQPNWLTWSNYSRTKGFYAQPKNSIEVIFLGTSYTVNAFIPMELYKEHGISAYNLGSEQQPMIASYYWLEEAYRRNKDSLKVVVMDVSNMKNTFDDAYFHKAIDQMNFSDVKYRAIKDFVSETGDTVSPLLPVLQYHDRWKSLEQTDFQKNDLNLYLQGYNFAVEKYGNATAYDKAGILETYYDDGAKEAQLDEESVVYMEKAIAFCETHNLKIVLCKTPTRYWKSSMHKSVERFAQEYGIEFYDFNFLPLVEEGVYNCYYDTVDSGHLNFYGAKKLTDWFGNYLVENTDVSNVKGQDKYRFLEQLLDPYQTEIERIAELDSADDVASYIKYAAGLDDTAVFISAKEEGAAALTDEHRALFNEDELGLKKLSELGYRDSYLAVIKDGNVITEESKSSSKDAVEEPLLAAGEISNMNYSVTSGGFYGGNTSSCIINGVEYSPNQRGLNIVIYDYKDNYVIESITFDTHTTTSKVSAERLEQYALYDRRLENRRKSYAVSQEIQKADFLQYLNLFNDEDYYIFISALDDAAHALTEENRSQFKDIGLSELAKLQFRDSYIGILCNGAVVYEKKDHGDTPTVYNGINYNITSGGKKSGNVSSIMIDQKEYSLKQRGLNVVIFDSSLKTVVSQKSFDTCSVTPTLLSADAGSTGRE